MKKRIVFSLVVSLLLSGCGFRPIYGSHGADGRSLVADEMNSVAIDNIPEREGQILRNALVDRMYRANRPDKPAYRLSIKIRSVEQDSGILANATVTRELLDVYGDYVLVDSKGKKLLSGTAHSVASFDKLDQIYGTVEARKNAYLRTLNEISEQVVNRLSLYFSERE
ncbi:MAG: LPS assembly lipoprotein LptE [Alphaproteobacteria bacterium]|nr:LPS assembly lipoprotein LptE [Alphaproteobacteria bacterium]